jgi:uncharacterized protein YbjT (DUF2867 family)
MQKPMILVTGATGAQGGSVAYALLQSGKYNVRAFTRNASSEKATALADAGAEVIEGTMDNLDDLKAAMHRCYGVFGVTNFWEHFEKEMEHGKNLIAAVHQSDIQHFVFSTLPGYKKLSNGELGVPHCDIKAELEDYSRNLGLKATYVHIAFYYENFLSFFPPQKAEDGNFHFGFPQGETPLSMIAAEDFGPIIASIFDNPEQYIGRVVGAVAEDDSCTVYAETMSKVLGEKVTYDYIPREVFASFGFPGAEELANMFDVQRRFVPERKAHKAESYKLHPGLQSFETWLTRNKEKFALAKEVELTEANI